MSVRQSPCEERKSRHAFAELWTDAARNQTQLHRSDDGEPGHGAHIDLRPAARTRRTLGGGRKNPNWRNVPFRCHRPGRVTPGGGSARMVTARFRSAVKFLRTEFALMTVFFLSFFSSFFFFGWVFTWMNDAAAEQVPQIDAFKELDHVDLLKHLL